MCQDCIFGRIQGWVGCVSVQLQRPYVIILQPEVLVLFRLVTIPSNHVNFSKGSSRLMQLYVWCHENDVRKIKG